MTKTIKIAIFGATFDPPHKGHLEIANYVHENFSVDKILFIPAGTPPHKVDKKVTDAKDRFRMAEMLAEKLDFAEVLDLEIKRQGVSFTIDTVKEVIKQYREAQLYLVIGSDQYNLFSTWKDYKEIVSLVNLIVFNRNEEDIKDFKDVMDIELTGKFCYDVERDLLTSVNGKTINFIRDFKVDVSSTEVREKIKNNEEVKDEVIEEVINYIKEKKLYK